MGLSGELSCHLRPLAPGLNFLSDAYYVTLTSEQGVTTLFLKVPPMLPWHLCLGAPLHG